MSFWEYVANFISWLFVPSADYFTNKVAALNVALNAKLGGVAYLFQQLHSFWISLDNVQSASITFTVPDNYLYSGYRGFTLDVLQSAYPYLSFLNDVLTPTVYIFTAIVCYHKLRSLFAEGGAAS